MSRLLATLDLRSSTSAGAKSGGVGGCAVSAGLLLSASGSRAFLGVDLGFTPILDTRASAAAEHGPSCIVSQCEQNLRVMP